RLVDRQRAANERLGLAKAVRGLKQQRKIVDVSCHIGMIRPEARFVNRQRTAMKRLGLAKVIRDSKQFREIIEANCNVGIIWPMARLEDRPSAAIGDAQELLLHVRTSGRDAVVPFWMEGIALYV